MSLTHFPNGITTGGVEVTPSVAIGGTVIRGAGTVATGLTRVDTVVASLANSGTAAGDPFTVIARPSGGDVIVEVKQDDDRAATTAGTVHIVAYGS